MFDQLCYNRLKIPSKFSVNIQTFWQEKVQGIAKATWIVVKSLIRDRIYLRLQLQRIVVWFERIKIL